MPRRILLVEDERDIADLVALHLEDVCDKVVIANDGHEGLHLATAQEWALIVLDLRLPGPDGLEICRTVRRERPYQPILMLTSKSSELDRVLGLESGADDYLTKPFSVLELTARVRAILRRVDQLRRGAEPEKADTVDAGPVSIDPARRQVLKMIEKREKWLAAKRPAQVPVGGGFSLLGTLQPYNPMGLSDPGLYTGDSGVEGWRDILLNPAEGITIAPGQSFFIQHDSSMLWIKKSL